MSGSYGSFSAGREGQKTAKSGHKQSDNVRADAGNKWP